MEKFFMFHWRSMYQFQFGNLITYGFITSVLFLFCTMQKYTVCCLDCTFWLGFMLKSYYDYQHVMSHWQAGLLDGVIAVFNVSSHETHPHNDTMYVVSALLLLVYVTFCVVLKRVSFTRMDRNPVHVHCFRLYYALFRICQNHFWPDFV